MIEPYTNGLDGTVTQVREKPPESYCDDPSYPCDIDDGGGSTGGGGSEGVSDTFSYLSGGSKTVCMVTDWYYNGQYDHTDVHYCWRE